MRDSHLGGDAAHRGFWGSKERSRIIWTVAIAAACATPLFAVALWAGVIGVLVAAGLAYLAVMPTPNGSWAHRKLKASRMRWRRRHGFDAFVPFNDTAWEELNQSALAATGRPARRAARRAVAAMRDTPDGVIGFQWLRDTVGAPGIQLHQPPHGEDYLAVVFDVAGQVEGLESEAAFEHTQDRFGGFLARFGSAQSFARRVQLTARVLPADSAVHEAWVAARADQSVQVAIAMSYRQLLDVFRRGQLIQRNYVTVSFPLTTQLWARARSRGDGWAGIVALIDAEIDQLAAALRTAEFRRVRPLTARRTMAVLRHLQHPGYPIDQVADLTPDTGWLPSQDEWSYTRYLAEQDGVLVQSLSRTARITADDLETAPRNSLWLHPLLSRLADPIVRTISFHVEISPQAEARQKAEQDVTSDDAETLKRRKEGQIDDAETLANRTNAQRRRDDLAPGSGIHGAAWVGYIQVAAGTPNELALACGAVEDAATEAGISRLGWLDTQQSTAAACTWPVGRGITPQPRSADARVRSMLAGTTHEEEL